MALGDVHIVNDPVIAQGANTASRCATVLSDALAKASAINEAFCRETEQKLWEAARSATEWTNATLQPPPPHVIELFMAAGGNKELANELVENFGSPDINWKIFGSPEGAAKFLAGHAGG
jgi:2-polyprenyl-6-methoxyphenol hydroxylase-like FAD-dependent oxidoreductase